jgi:type I restriction enzyme S subunit
MVHLFKSDDYKGEGIPLIKIGQFKNCSIDISQADYLSEYYIDEYKNYLLSNNDLIIAMSGGTTGKIAVIKDSDLPAFLN